MTPDEQLEDFKTNINLTYYAAAQGYNVIKNETSRNSVAMKHPVTGDKIIIARRDNGHWVYFSINDSSDKGGSIIDFVQNREGGNLGAVRQNLAKWNGSKPLLPPERYVSRVEKSSKDRHSILRLCTFLQAAEEQDYLKSRAIGTKDILGHPRFTHRIFHDPKHGAACFLYEDGQGVCGVEQRNTGFKGFAPGSEKGIWRSNCFKADQNLVFTESPIDALSYHALHPNYHTRYMALGGAWSEKTKLLIESAAKKHPGQTITLAFDNDTQGKKYAEDAKHIISTSTAKHIIVDFPTTGKDWNEQLLALQQVAEPKNTHQERLEKPNGSRYKVR